MNRRNTWYGWALLVGAAYIISALVSAPGVTYAVIAIAAGLGFVIVTRATRHTSRGGTTEPDA